MFSCKMVGPFLSLSMLCGVAKPQRSRKPLTSETTSLFLFAMRLFSNGQCKHEDAACNVGYFQSISRPHPPACPTAESEPNISCPHEKSHHGSLELSYNHVVQFINSYSQGSQMMLQFRRGSEVVNECNNQRLLARTFRLSLKDNSIISLFWIGPRLRPSRIQTAPHILKQSD